MKYVFILLVLLKITSARGQDSVLISNLLNSSPVNVYKEPSCINKIGEISGGDYVFVLDKKKDLCFLVYRKGITGYISWSWLRVWQKDYVYLGGDINSKVALAKEKEIKIDTKLKNDSLLNHKSTEELAKKNKRNGIGLSRLEYIDGRFYCGFEFSITNYADKTIKYFQLTVSAYNPVDDLVATKSFSYVGPVSPTETSSYKSDLVFNQNAISYYRVKKISVQYINGDKREYSGKALKEILDSND